MQLSACALRTIELLESAGFEACAVGGCVRDFLLGRTYHDVDITTSALASEVHDVLERANVKLFDTGIKHGTVTAVFGDRAPYEEIEITTFRIDGPYLDNRHPEQVTFTRSLEEDLSRRDFTINAMAFNPRMGIIDMYGGQDDLANKTIRCVGDADKRFEEDALRIMRALRFSSQLGFAIEPSTAKALRKHAPLLNNIARERIGIEFTKLLCGPDVRAVLLDYTDVIGVALPQLVPLFGFDQHNAHHPYDVWEHTAVTVCNIPSEPALRYAALLHDIAKPATFSLEDGVGHFYGHAKKGEELAREVCESLRLSNALTHEICLLVGRHDIQLEPTEKNMRRWLCRMGPESLKNLLALKRADTTALASQYFHRLEDIDLMEEITDRLVAEEACFSLKDLAVRGNDLLQAGFEPGPNIGAALAWLLDQVIEGEAPNEKEALLMLAKKKFSD